MILGKDPQRQLKSWASNQRHQWTIPLVGVTTPQDFIPTTSNRSSLDWNPWFVSGTADCPFNPLWRLMMETQTVHRWTWEISMSTPSGSMLAPHSLTSWKGFNLSHRYNLVALFIDRASARAWANWLFSQPMARDSSALLTSRKKFRSLLCPSATVTQIMKQSKHNRRISPFIPSCWFIDLKTWKNAFLATLLLWDSSFKEGKGFGKRTCVVNPQTVFSCRERLITVNRWHYLRWFTLFW